MTDNGEDFRSLNEIVENLNQIGSKDIQIIQKSDITLGRPSHLQFAIVVPNRIIKDDHLLITFPQSMVI